MPDVHRHKVRGFTLIELIVVMGILGLLMVLGFSSFQTSRMKARDAKRKSDLATIAKSLEAYVNDHARYPSAATGKIQCKNSDYCDWGEEFSDDNGTIYTAALPEEDFGNSYYWYESNGTSFSLYAHLENENDPAVRTFSPSISCGTGTDCNYKVTSSNIN